jgi:hypothetical protein
VYRKSLSAALYERETVDGSNLCLSSDPVNRYREGDPAYAKAMEDKPGGNR